MSLSDGLSAINLEMSGRVPRTEYSAAAHWELVKVVTGIPVGADSSAELQTKASQEFVKKWNFDFIWNILINSGKEFGEKRTRMGHAVYATGGTDYSNKIFSLYEEPEDALKFDPWELYGSRDKKTLIAAHEEHYKNSCKMFPECVNMSGIYITLVSGLIDIMGWETLLAAAGIDPEGFGEVANRYTSWIQQHFNALAEADVPVVMIHDDIVWSSGAIFHPQWYRKYIFPNYKKLFAPLIESGKKIIYTSDGNYTDYIDDVVDCGVHGFVMEPTTDMAYVAENYGKSHVFIGNADTRILLNGSKEEIYAEVKRCMDIGKKYPGFFLAVGNHIPSNTPVESAIYYNEVYEKLSRR